MTAMKYALVAQTSNFIESCSAPPNCRLIIRWLVASVNRLLIVLSINSRLLQVGLRAHNRAIIRTVRIVRLIRIVWLVRVVWLINRHLIDWWLAVNRLRNEWRLIRLIRVRHLIEARLRDTVYVANSYLSAYVSYSNRASSAGKSRVRDLIDRNVVVDIVRCTVVVEVTDNGRC